MKRLFVIIAAWTLPIGVCGCSPDNTTSNSPDSEQPGGNNGDNEQPDPPDEDVMEMIIEVGSAVFTATLADNPAARAFRGMLPMTVKMTEHAGNEKYYDLPESLPEAAHNPGTIRNGDIMLYGTKTLVLFYKTFSTSYGYTRVGNVNAPSGLESALGRGDVTVTFEPVPR